jgi:hypothetical protein
MTEKYKNRSFFYIDYRKNPPYHYLILKLTHKGDVMKTFNKVEKMSGIILLGVFLISISCSRSGNMGGGGRR